MGYKYKLPSEDVNDDSAIIVKLYFESGKKVKKNDLLYAFETTKAVVDVKSDHAGYVMFYKNLEEKVIFDENICEIFKIKKDYDEAFNQPIKEKTK